MLGLRAATAAVLLGVFAAALFLAPGPLWAAFCVLALVPAAWEWGRLARLTAGLNAAFTLVVVGSLVAVILTPLAVAVPAIYVAAAVFWLLFVPAWLRRRPALRGALPALAGWVVLVPAYAALVHLREQGAGLLLGVMAIVWISDTAAYLVGRRYGRNKLAPSISPGKTWEGFWGALCAVGVYSALFAIFAPEAVPGRLSGLPIIPAALGLAVLGVIGDLFESQLKRAAGVKDSGKTLPGHGGILDRIDALLPVLPVAAWLVGRFGQ